MARPSEQVVAARSADKSVRARATPQLIAAAQTEDAIITAEPADNVPTPCSGQCVVVFRTHHRAHRGCGICAICRGEAKALIPRATASNTARGLSAERPAWRLLVIV